MLRGIADFAMQGRWQAAAMTALLSVAALIFPPVNYLASGVISLTTLRMGPREGAKVVTATLIVFLLLAAVLVGKLWIVGLSLLTSWLPVFLVTLALGYTRSFATSVLAAAGLGILVVVTMHLAISEPVAWWFEMIKPFMQTLSEQGNWQLDNNETRLVTSKLAVWMTGLVAAGVTLNALLGLIIGRSWQSKLYNQGAFSEEFRQLRLGRTFAGLAVIPMALSLTPYSGSLSLIIDCLFVVLLTFSVQGLAIVHAIVAEKQKNKAWLVILYILLIVMMPQMMMVLATIGVLDQWFNFRKLQSNASI